MQPEVVVIIVSYGNTDEVIHCVSALANSSFAAFAIIIVENKGSAAYDALYTNLITHAVAKSGEGQPGPADASRIRLRAKRSSDLTLATGQPALIVESVSNLGYGGAVNLALATLEGNEDWRGVWILNPDAEPDRRALELLVRYAETGRFGLIGCRLVGGDGRVQLRGGYWRPLMGRGKSIGYNDPAGAAVDVAKIEQRLQWVSGAACYATRAFVQAVGQMTEKFFLYCEDVEWSLRGRPFQLGYAHDAVVYHSHGTSIGSAASIRERSTLSIYLAQRNALLLTRQQFPWLYPLVVLTMFFLSADYLIRGNLRTFVAACRGWWAGVRGENGIPKAFD